MHLSSLTQARIASITSGMLSLIWQITRLLGLIVLDETSCLPKAWHTLPKRLWLQTQLRLDELAKVEATIP